MKDTSSDIEIFYCKLLLAKSGEERFKMGFSMLAAARKIVIASIREEKPGIPLSDLRVELFHRFYGSEMDEKKMEKIINRIRKTGYAKAN